MLRNGTAVLLMLYPFLLVAQAGFEDSTSMDVFIEDSAAKGCFRAASIAARIHYTSSSELENCTKALNRTAMSPRDRAATLTNRGIIHMALNDYEPAIRDFSSALDLKPEFGEIHINLGNIYYLNKDYQSAVKQYSSAIEKQSTKIHVGHINRGMAYEKLGDFTLAEQDYRRAVELLPGASLPQVKLEALLEKMAEAASAGRPTP